MKFIISWILRHIPRKLLQRFSHVILKALQIFYLGNKVHCPVCGKSYRRFMPYGRGPVRENVLCPNCLSLERHRLLWIYLKERTDFFSRKLKFLHIAPELCFITRFRNMDNLDYITADLESPLADVKMDIHQIPFEDNTFDVVMCNHVMEHVADDMKAMKEIFRVLKTGGWSVLQVPFMGKNLKETYEDNDINTPKAREQVYGQSDHVRIYGQDYPDRLRSAGFTVKEDRFIDDISPEKVRYLALPADETIYFNMKE